MALEAVDENGKEVFNALRDVQASGRKLDEDATQRIINGIVKPIER